MNEVPFSLSINTETIVALITLAGVILSVGYARLAHSQAKGANVAVNNRGPEAPKIYDLVFKTYEELIHMRGWKKGYEGGPLDSGAKVVHFVNRVDNMDNRIKEIQGSLDLARDDIIKYGCPVKSGERDLCIRDE
jgi:hypothetical protein